MNLFDVIRDMNDKLNIKFRDGRASKRIVGLTATTDGYNSVVHFMGSVVWESTAWNFDESNSEEVEVKRIAEHIAEEVNKMTAVFAGVYL